MTTYVDETFAGAVGIITGSAPSTAPAGMTWTNGYYNLYRNGTGLARAEAIIGTAASGSGMGYLGSSSGTVDYGLPQSGRIIISLIWGSFTGYQVGGYGVIGTWSSLSVRGAYIQAGVSGNTLAGSLLVYVGGNYLPVTVSANTAYDLVIDYTPTSVICSFNGVTVSQSFTDTGVASGLNFVGIGASYYANGGVQYDRLQVTDPPAPVFVPWWRNKLLMQES